MKKNEGLPGGGGTALSHFRQSKSFALILTLFPDDKESIRRGVLRAHQVGLGLLLAIPEVLVGPKSPLGSPKHLTLTLILNLTLGKNFGGENMPKGAAGTPGGS